MPLIVPAPEVAQMARDAGWDGYRIVTAVAVSKGESNHDAYAINVVSNRERPKADGTGLEANPAFRSIDVGLYQPNLFWHPKLSLADALDPFLNTAFAFNLWRYRFETATGSFEQRVAYAWQPWHIYTSGAWTKYRTMAVDACRQAGIKV